MKFKFDPEKSEANKAKRGIDFVDGQALWEDPDRLQLTARTQGEPRLMLIGRIGDKHWSAIFTIRDDGNPDHFDPAFPDKGGRAV